MKCGIRTVALLLALACGGCAKPQPSAKSDGQTVQPGWPQAEAHKLKFYFTTDDGPPYRSPLPFSPEQIEKAKHAKDSRPAEKDPEGNWGAVAEGFQLSLRFEKESYTNGEPVTACVILRNVSDRPLVYPYEYTPDEREIAFVLMRGQDRVYGKYDARPGASFTERLGALRMGHGWDRASPVGTQHKSLVNLSKIFGLATNGEYVIQAKREIPTSYLTGMTNVASGKVTFRIFDRPK